VDQSTLAHETIFTARKHTLTVACYAERCTYTYSKSVRPSDFAVSCDQERIRLKMAKLDLDGKTLFEKQHKIMNLYVSSQSVLKWLAHVK